MTAPDLNNLTHRLRAFAKARDWEQYHTPKNLAMALSVEVAELVEHFQWLTPEEAGRLVDDPVAKSEVASEIADVAIYLIRLADVLGIDLARAAQEKIEVNEVRFPVVRHTRRTDPETSSQDDPYAEPFASDYVKRTWGLDMEPLRCRFLSEVQKRTGAEVPEILDVGSGSGRDLAAFRDAGCKVLGIDPSPDLARLAEEGTGVPVEVCRVQDLSLQNEVDGIWACASLLHVPWDELPDAFRRLAQALRPGGVLYASFKWGEAERKEGKRHFTDLTDARLDDRLSEVPELELLDVWVTEDVRPERSNAQWLNAVLLRRDQEHG